ncbi:phosphodiester glycosidase family protein [Luteolibacter luteus]|uniref:Phosphodiester glycosidase family protein n=1 Tax=Luteolibacter luteus TaxID=2728835 RepID=A0A858RND0_9BACT|nr:phosphodiester glycosidase family protein [Luteolibacter luteus]QJE98372.1 phosphodiester glycosidase family protein [Luteolibacter luteus]
MLRHFVLPLLALAASCTSQKQAPVTLPEIPIAGPEEVQASPVKPPETDHVAVPPSQAIYGPKLVRTNLSGIPITFVTFDTRTHQLKVADQANGPGSRWADAEAAGRATGGIAAINGGFFTPEGKPLGIVVSSEGRAGSLNRSSLGSGWYVGGNSPSLLRNAAGSAATDLLQSGPFLVEHGKAVGGLSKANSSARTFIGWDGGTRWFIARSGSCSLADLAQALAGSETGGVKARSVLNLDGGRSSDLWVSSSVQGGPLSERPFWNKPVRNFVVLVPRS